MWYMRMNEDLIVDGFLFGTASDSKLAKEEAEKIEYLDANMNYANIAKVAQLYDKALDSKMFKTPVGWSYLNKLKRILLENGYIEDEIRAIPVNAVFARTEESDSLVERIRPKKRKPDPYKNKFSFAVVVIIGLLIAIIAMFVITMTAETPNMINYRNAIVNEYAGWEQDIKEREDAVRLKERELGIPSPLPRESNESE